VACTAPPNSGDGRVSGRGEFNPLVISFRSGVGREREESWVVNPTLVMVNVLLNLLDNVIESADRPGEVIHIEVDDYSVLGGTLVSVFSADLTKPTTNLSERRAMYVGKRGILPA